MEGIRLREAIILDQVLEQTIACFRSPDYVDSATGRVVRRIFDEGHTVGLHSDDRWLMFKSSAYTVTFSRTDRCRSSGVGFLRLGGTPGSTPLVTKTLLRRNNTQGT